MDDDEEDEEGKGGFFSGLGKGMSSAGSNLMRSGGNFQYGNIFGDR